VNYLVDSNACIALLNQSSERVRENFGAAKLAKSQLFLSSIVIHELWFGVANSERLRWNAPILRKFISQGFIPLDFTDRDAEIAGQIRATLRAAGTPIGAYDTLIAGQALARGLTVVTANTREFARVDHLSIVDWTL
jgi:tRNA(fMet)-specific endonuclease VapC